jgi:hypothetical protein
VRCLKKRIHCNAFYKALAKAYIPLVSSRDASHALGHAATHIPVLFFFPLRDITVENGTFSQSPQKIIYIPASEGFILGKREA